MVSRPPSVLELQLRAYHDSKLVARRSDRSQRIGQEHLYARTFLENRSAVIRLLPRAGQR